MGSPDVEPLNLVNLVVIFSEYPLMELNRMSMDISGFSIS